MINTDIFKYSSSNSGYESDNSSYSSDSSNSFKSSNSSNSNSNSSNSSNYTITSDPINHYRKDVLKQNYVKSLSRRKQQTQTNLELKRNKVDYNRNESGCESGCESKSVDIGLNSGLDKNNPLIDHLINKRMSFCDLGSYSHIAAFVPVANNDRYCFLRGWKGKDRYG